MLDVGWPFYGLDQADLSADADFDSYFNELLSVAGMDLLHLPVWEQGRYADVQDGGDNAVLRVVRRMRMGCCCIRPCRLLSRKTCRLLGNRWGALFQDDLPVIQPAVDTAGEALWLGVLRAAGRRCRRQRLFSRAYRPWAAVAGIARFRFCCPG